MVSLSGRMTRNPELAALKTPWLAQNPLPATNRPQSSTSGHAVSVAAPNLKTLSVSWGMTGFVCSICGPLRIWTKHRFEKLGAPTVEAGRRPCLVFSMYAHIPKLGVTSFLFCRVWW